MADEESASKAIIRDSELHLQLTICILYLSPVMYSLCCLAVIFIVYTYRSLFRGIFFRIHSLHALIGRAANKSWGPLLILIVGPRRARI